MLKRRVVSMVIITSLMSVMMFFSPASNANADTTSPIAWWKLNENTGTTVNDSSGSGYNGTKTGAAWTVGKEGSALSFDGSGDYVNIPNCSANIGSNFTLAAWIKTPAGSGNYRVLLAKGPKTTGHYELNITPGDVLQFYSQEIGAFSTANAVADNNWHHIAVTYNGSKVIIYVDGYAQISQTASGTIANSTNTLYLGSLIDGTLPYNGTLDGVRIYNSALASAEIISIFRQENGGIKTVKQDGTGEFTTITSAIQSITAASSENPYEIVIYPGVYLEKSIQMKNYVSLRGTDKDACIIQGELPDSATDGQITPASTLDWMTTGYIKDLTITCKNMRYPIHSDAGAYGNKDGRQEIYNCYIEHKGNQGVIDYRIAHGLSYSGVWGALHAWGCGTSDGMVVIARDTTFISPTTAFYFHENMSFSKPSYLELENCKMIATNDGGCAIYAQGYGSGRNGKLVVNNCEIVGYTDIDVGNYLPESLALTYFRSRECTFAGGGNTLSPVRIHTTTNALRITSQSTGAVSTVRLSGTAVSSLFATPSYNDGAGGIKGYAEGNTDISSSNPNTPLTSLGRRLGNRTSSPWTLVITIDGSTPVTVTFNQDYTNMTNEQIITIIQNALGSAGNVEQLGVGFDYYPEYADQVLHLYNTSNEGIQKGMAVAYNTGFKNCRKMTNTDEAEDFVGIAMEDIKPGQRGLILKKGIVFDAPGGKLAGNGNHGILQYTYQAAAMGDKFGISSQPGYLQKDGEPVIAKCVAPNMVQFGAK